MKGTKTNMSVARLATKQLQVTKSDGTRYDIRFPGTLELSNDSVGDVARYDLGRGTAVAHGRSRRSQGTVTLESPDARYVWSLA